MRIATMTRQLLDEVHTQTLDAASRDRLGTIDTHIIDELLTDLAPTYAKNCSGSPCR